MGLTLIDPPGLEPITLEQAKAFLRVDADHEDGVIADLIAAARQRVETATGRALIAQTWRETRDAWSGGAGWDPVTGAVRLPKPPLIEVTEIAVTAADGSSLVLDPGSYRADPHGEPGRIVRTGLASWPAPASPVSGVSITFIAGYGADPSTVPADLIQALLLLIAHSFERRDGADAPWPDPVLSLIGPYRAVRL
ncbi:MAG: head-tail connector protein [Maricaulaceae bacterium]